ncbi:hypothetical protein COC42_15025 [Sphingomonas spermidinifaciens]|uniref:Uncharacterized protein n=1 Tax=Sphingomonas spermidinifaciens TaxID=1141889 RepID=A0A2A4B4V6_9SPHN|nr:hypothetical protein [Sphingomonas spermidinifaciens]PCD02694.1 hypothetical protein COC42_15025 [Sphingomonas spermidinifaciens]
MARGPDAGALVERALNLSAAAAGVPMRIVEASATRWASATFAGARHVLDLEVGGDRASRAWLGALGEAELPMRGQLMADCTVVATRVGERSVCARVEALTVETA